MTTGTKTYADVVVLVPALNEEHSVGEVVRDLRAHLPRVVVIDDGSTDATSQVARRAGATVVRHPVNLGQGAAIQTGFAYILADPSVARVVTFDSDGQHRVEDALAMLATAEAEGVDVVLGSRFIHGVPSIPFIRRLVLRAAIRFTRITTRLPLTDTHNGLRVLNRRAVETMDLTLGDMAHASQLLGLIARHRLTYVEVPVTIAYTAYSRARGQSSLNALNIAFDLAVERMRGRR